MNCPYCQQPLVMTMVYPVTTIENLPTNHIPEPRREYYYTNFSCGYQFPRESEYRKPGEIWYSNR